MIIDEINWIEKLITLRQLGYNVIDNVKYEVVEEDEGETSEIVKI